MARKKPTSVVKASVISGEIDAPNASPTAEDDQRLFRGAGAIIPPYPPSALNNMYERSALLRPNIDAYITNIESFGYRLEPTIDLEKADAEDRIRDALLLERIYDGKPAVIDDEDVGAAQLELKGAMRMEKLMAELFFTHCSIDVSFEELRMRTRLDLEVTGNAYWEVIRNAAGEPAQFFLVASHSVRLMRADVDFTDVEMVQRISALTFRRVSMKRRFRRYVQVVNGHNTIFFKDLNDPRTVSGKTGRVYRDLATLRDKEGSNAIAATEMIHFKIPSPASAYGIPRWIGATLAVLGSRASEEVNVIYFDNKAVPPLAVLVSGGTLAKGAAERIEGYIKDQIRGRDNFHSILIIEADGTGTPSIAGAQGARVKVELKPLRDAQQDDALFQKYEESNALKVGAQFRLPKLLRGDAADVNRATADAALQYTEQQVFQPERARVDYIINHHILPLKRIRFFEFISNSPIEKDPPELIDMVVKLVEAAIISPDEARPLVSDAINKELRTDPDAMWMRIPPSLLIAGYKPPPVAEDDDQPKPPDVGLSETDAALLLTVNEARASLGVGALMLADGQPDPNGSLSFYEYQQRLKAGAGAGGAPGLAGGGGQDGAPVAGASGAPPVREQMSMEDLAQKIIQLRNAIQVAEQHVAHAALGEARRKEGELVIAVEPGEFRSWFERTDNAAE